MGGCKEKIVGAAAGAAAGAFVAFIASKVAPSVASWVQRQWSRWRYRFIRIGSKKADGQPNPVFRAVQRYLREVVSSSDSRYTELLTVNAEGDSGTATASYAQLPREDLHVLEACNDGQATDRSDTGQEVKTVWRLDCSASGSYYTLQIPRSNVHWAQKQLLPRIQQQAETIRQQRSLRLYCHGGHLPGQNAPLRWYGQSFTTSATFSNTVLSASNHSVLKDKISDFMKPEAGKRHADWGRPWRCGILLHGPPGTGKSQTISALANEHRLDVYKVDLSNLVTNSELEQLVAQVQPKDSLVVFEDIDRTLDRVFRPDEAAATSAHKEAESKINLAGLLNTFDGLINQSVERRIYLLTTNHMDKMPPELTRSLRMNYVLQLSYVDGGMFKRLCLSHGIAEAIINDWIEHSMFARAVKAVQMTPAKLISKLEQPQDAFCSQMDTLLATTNACVAKQLEGSATAKAR
ncbi:hypothetical protein WJX84_002968 [Apatococcus fuscideae]|uniref:AAA+ ATPase domain-containing protein n=1 Tax=Apatococcus fuscideae TaxID=2026836 RepID=A0AAW1RQA2_9CHLO